jgi:hypothetical protein
MIRAFIFDLDGVLTDTAEYHYRAWKRLADEAGLHFTRELPGLARWSDAPSTSLPNAATHQLTGRAPVGCLLHTQFVLGRKPLAPQCPPPAATDTEPFPDEGEVMLFSFSSTLNYRRSVSSTSWIQRDGPGLQLLVD